MNQRKLGKSGIEISAMGLGCWAIGGPFWSGDGKIPFGWGEVDDEESIRAIHRAMEMGVNFFDTANVYGCGHSERVLGRAFEGRRDQVVIATKFANLFDENTRRSSGQSVAPDDIRQACEDSLRRLNTDYIDLYQLHWNDYPAELAVEIREFLEVLVSEGKIRAYGWSTDFVDRAAAFAEGKHCAAIQLEMNVINDAAPMIAFCEAHSLAAINRGPLAMGLLTGKYQSGSNLAADDVRGKQAPEWMKYFKDGKPNPEWLQKMDAIRDILTSGGRTVAQGALAWLWGRSENTIPIPGFRTVEQVNENCGALALGALTPDQMAQIDTILDRVGEHG